MNGALEKGMSDNSAIEWTDSTWNPVTGCSKVSEGCRNCYAEALSLRFGRSKKPWSAQFASENVVLHEDRLDYPRKWKDPRRIFVNSMSDLFHKRVPDSFITKVFRVMGQASHHTYQVLTKRPERMQSLLLRWTDRYALRMLEEGDIASQWPLPNVWVGTSVALLMWLSRNSSKACPATASFCNASNSILCPAK